MSESSDAVAAFRQAMSERGLVYAGELLQDGRLHRFRAGDDADASAWYVLHPANPIPAGAYGCWRRQINEKWHANGTSNLSKEDHAALQQSWREAEVQRQKDEADRHERFSLKARQYCDSLPAATADHFYLEKKKVSVFGLKLNADGDLVIPLADAAGKIWSYQTIDPLGEKLFMPGGRVRGCFHLIGARGDGPLILCEGYATGATIHEATGWETCCVMNCGNLLVCALDLRKLHPSRKIVLAADDDRNTEGNPGLTKATEAARKISAGLMVPDFPDSYEGNGTDFNDLLNCTSLREVRNQIFSLLGHPIARTIGELSIPERNDPDELLKHRFLCRGGGLLIVGPTGIGKSSLTLQMLALLANGLPAFGIEPSRPLRSIYIQAENDDGDLAEIRDGVAKGLEFTEVQRSNFFTRVIVHSETEHISRSFFDKVVIPLLSSNPGLDLLVIDPALSYIGAEAKDQRAVGEFLRTFLSPILRKFSLAAIIVHHTNKPPSGNQKPDWTLSEMAYLGSGSIEWANWSRAVLAMQGTKTPGVFKLNAAKRGARLEWKDEANDRCYQKLIKHCKSDGVICWMPATQEETEPGDGGRPRKAELDDFIALLEPESLTAGRWIALCKSELGISRATFYRLLETAEKEGLVLKSKVNGKWTLVLDRK